MKAQWFLLPVAILVLVACRPTPEEIASLTTDAETLVAVMWTEIPTATFSPTKTPLPTETPLPSATATPTNTRTPTPDPNFIPQFVNTNYLELDKIWQISLFRSSEGHDYCDSYESCRSMKHYFKPYDYLDWSSIRIFAPVSGEIIQTWEEWAGTQIHVRSDEYPEYVFIIFHVDLKSELHVGSRVDEGEELGSHIGNVTHLDIAVGREGTKYRLVSYFEVMTDELFLEFQARGVESRSNLIISREERDADPLTCDGEVFTSLGTLPRWYTLTPP